MGAEIESPSLIADARHMWVDMLSNAVVLAGLLSSLAGFNLDRIAAFIVVFFIAWAGGKILIDGVRVLLDASLDYQTLSSAEKLILAGIIQDEAYYRRHVEPFLDKSDVVYVGSVGPTERNRLLGHASALLHPIHFNEPFGLSIIESMACGTPVIAFNKGSMPELIKNNKNSCKT